MGGPLPAGAPVPRDGAIPAAALADLNGAALSVYLHVPFCASRCGYCDFNTYTDVELGGSLTEAYLAAAHAEIDLAARILDGHHAGVATVFVGGGTPTLLPPVELVRLLRHVDDALGLAQGAEVTTEANPESIDEASLAVLRAGGFTRVSLGMQSVTPSVLALLERRHSPARAQAAVGWARAAGFEHVNLDLIYGSPGETLTQWRSSLTAVLEAGVDHVSAYALIVEDGTRLASKIRRGELADVDDELHADLYLEAERVLTAAGLENYEISNWARPGSECAHNQGYWRSQAWWGIGPGAHSHVGGYRWWNVKHPRTYVERLIDGASPADAGEQLGPDDRRIERVLLELRLREGLPLDVLTPTEQERVPVLLERGLATVDSGRLRLSLDGRLLADGVVRDLLD